MLQGLRPGGYLRYTDDMLLLSNRRQDLHEWHAAVRTFLAERLHLELRDDAMRLMPVTQGVPFLGFRIWPSAIRLDAARVRRFRRSVRAIEDAVDQGRLDEAAAQRRLSSVVGHAEQAQTLRLRQSFFERRG